jgi:hypothetical protein
MQKPNLVFAARLPNAFTLLQACLDAGRKAGWTPEETDTFLQASKAGPIYDVPAVCHKYCNILVKAVMPNPL